VKGLDRYRDMAYSLSLAEIHTALDLDREPPALRRKLWHDDLRTSVFVGATARRGGEQVRQSLGRSMASRVPAGTRTGTTKPHEERADAGLRRGPVGLDRRPRSARMLDDTLVMVLSEHGRTPRINRANGGGRDHWSQAYTTLFAGGGIARGRVVAARIVTARR